MTLKMKTVSEAYSLDPYKGMPNHPLIVRAEGCWLYDEAGRRYWDASGGSGAVNLGHQHPRVVQAVREQAESLLHVGWNVPTGIRRELVQRLGRYAPYDECAILLAVSGTEATEAAFKIARAATGRQGVLAFDRAFHGKSTGALGATWRAAFRAYSAFDREKYRSVPYPFEGIGGMASVTAETCLSVLRATLEEASHAGGLPAAMILEPIQVSEGIHAGGAGFIQQAVELARGYGIVVVFDEIYTGFGRTGAPFACTKLGVIPDLLLIGKGLGNGIPISGVIGPPSIMNALPAGNHSSTFAANPLSCAAGLAVLDVLEATDVVQEADQIGGELMQHLGTLSRGESGGIISKPRGEGLLIGFDLLDDNGECSPARAKLFAERAMDAGILLRWGGFSGSTIKVTPPLIINPEELDWVCRTFTAILESLRESVAGEAKQP